MATKTRANRAGRRAAGRRATAGRRGGGRSQPGGPAGLVSRVTGMLGGSGRRSTGSGRRSTGAGGGMANRAMSFARGFMGGGGTARRGRRRR
jgi:hypothetical protein